MSVIASLRNLRITRTGIESRSSLNFDPLVKFTLELLKYPIDLHTETGVLGLAALLFELHQTHKFLNEFEIRPFRLTCLLGPIPYT